MRANITVFQIRKLNTWRLEILPSVTHLCWHSLSDSRNPSWLTDSVDKQKAPFSEQGTLHRLQCFEMGVSIALYNNPTNLLLSLLYNLQGTMSRNVFDRKIWNAWGPRHLSTMHSKTMVFHQRSNGTDEKTLTLLLGKCLSKTLSPYLWSMVFAVWSSQVWQF